MPFVLSVNQWSSLSFHLALQTRQAKSDPRYMETRQITQASSVSSTPLICRIRELSQLMDAWPDMLRSAEPQDREELLGVVIHCMVSGLLLNVSLEKECLGFCAVSLSSESVAIVHSLPAGPTSNLCLKIVHDWGRKKGVKTLTLISHRLNGCNFRHIEKSLGFRREAMIFTQPIPQNG